MISRLLWISCALLANVHLQAQPENYMSYHQSVLDIEQLIASNQFNEALSRYDQLFQQYEFVFLEDYKIAAQLAAHLGDEYRAFDYLGLGVSNGWTLKEIKKHQLLKPLKKNPRWFDLEKSYEALRQDFEDRINDSLRAVIRDLSKEDQKMAFKYLLKPSQKARDKFIAQEVIPLNERQMEQLQTILDQIGYPGEKLIGNSVWMSTILGHHNSISPEYQQADTIFPRLKPQLLQAVNRGEMDPLDLAIIDDWYLTVKSDHQQSSYGIIKPITPDEVDQCNHYRSQLGLRSVQLRNALVEIQQKTGMDLYLDMGSWLKGKIPTN